jgi:hypothetical protein
MRNILLLMIFWNVLVNFSGCSDVVVLRSQKRMNTTFGESCQDKPISDRTVRTGKEIWTVLEPVTYELQKMYSENYRALGERNGSIKIKIVIEAHGAIIDLKIMRSSFKGTKCEMDFINRVKKIKFPDVSKIQEKDIAEINLPFNFYMD